MGYTCLSPPRFIEVHVARQERDRCIYVLYLFLSPPRFIEVHVARQESDRFICVLYWFISTTFH